MPTATRKAKSDSRTSVLLEERVISESHNVDRTAHVIKNVKILGRDSKNGREYSDKALQEAAALYEGTTVNVNHPPRANPNQERGFEEGIAVIRGAAAKSDGVYGDLHYFESHPHAPLMLERAEKHAGTFGLSHNADGQTTNHRGRTIVESVTKVRSVDLVGKPATTKGLFESEHEPVTQTIKQILESVSKKTAGHKQLLEMVEGDPAMGALPVDMPMENDKPTEKPEEQIKAGIMAGIMAKLEKADESQLAAVLDALGMGDSLSAAAAGKAGKGGGEGDKGGKGKEEPTTESAREKAAMDERITKLQESVDELTSERDQLKAENTARALLESLDRDATPLRIKQLCLLETEAERKAAINEWPKRQTNGAPPKRTVALAESEEPGEYKPAANSKEWAALVR